MIKPIEFPLKSAYQIDLVNAFQKYVTQQYGMDEWKKIEELIMSIHKQRQTLDFTKFSAQLANDHRLCDEIETKAIQYIRHIYTLDSVFKAALTIDKNPLKCDFSWSDTLHPIKKGNAFNSTKYELMSVLYNLACIYHTSAINLAMTTNEEDKIKAASKLQRGYWCLTEIKQLTPLSLIDPKNLPIDLNPAYINAMASYFVGMGYKILMPILESKNANETRLASINKGSADNFLQAFKILYSSNPKQYPDFINIKLKSVLLYYGAIHNAKAYDYLAKYHLKLVDEEILKGHMGLAVSYLRHAKNELNIYVSKKEYYEKLDSQQKEEIMQLVQYINKNYDIYKEKNDRIYHQPEYDESKLPEIPKEQIIIQALEPKDIRKVIDQEYIFECCLASELLDLKKEFMNLILTKMVTLGNMIKSIKDNKGKVYSKEGIPWYLELANTVEAIPKEMNEVTHGILKKLDKFHKNGKIDNYEKIKDDILNANKFTTENINMIKDLLAKEKEEDDLARELFLEEWDRPPSNQLNVEFFNQLRILEQKYAISQAADEKIMKKYEDTREWMEKLSQSTDSIIDFIPKRLDYEFIQKYRNELNELAALNKRLDEIINLDLNKFLDDIKETFLKSNFFQRLNAIYEKRVDKKQEFDSIMDTQKEKFDELTSKINEGDIIIEQIVIKVNELNSRKSRHLRENIKLLEDIVYNIDIINDLYNDLINGAKFYEFMTLYLSNLCKVVKDYCNIRDNDKEMRFAKLDAEKAKLIESTSRKTGNFPTNKSLVYIMDASNSKNLEIPQDHVSFQIRNDLINQTSQQIMKQSNSKDPSMSQSMNQSLAKQIQNNSSNNVAQSMKQSNLKGENAPQNLNQSLAQQIQNNSLDNIEKSLKKLGFKGDNIAENLNQSLAQQSQNNTTNNVVQNLRQSAPKGHDIPQNLNQSLAQQYQNSTSNRLPQSIIVTNLYEDEQQNKAGLPDDNNADGTKSQYGDLISNMICDLESSQRNFKSFDLTSSTFVPNPFRKK